jgi:HD-GYP domain-containing protein (c-di-GMP phosphodiesterase class II)
MGCGLPDSPQQLRWMLARRLGVAALVIGFAAGGISYLIETRRAEQAALEYAAEGAQHFETPALDVAADGRTSEGHGALNRLLDRSRFVGIRVFGADRGLIYESWADVSESIVDSVRSGQHRHDWPGRGQSHRNWIEIDGQRLIQVVLPLFEKDGRLSGYLEGVSRVDEKTLREQREQIRNGTLSAVAVVLLTALLLYPLLLAMLRRSAELSGRLLDSNLSLMNSLGNAIAKRDSDTNAHNYRVTYYAVALAEAMGMAKQDISDLVAGAFLHDVGKIGISDRILLKPGKLSAEEFEIMKTHALLGVEIVEDNPWLKGAALTIRHHHERFDGTGYPTGLRGNAIPLNARVFAVVDVFDALTSERPYKKPMALAEALSILERDSGQHFDPEVVLAFKAIGPNLYEKAFRAGNTELRQRMREALSRYFQTGVAL